MMLNEMWAYAARLAFLDRFNEAIHEVIVVPRSAPSENATAVCQSRMPAPPSPMTMPIVAEDEWIIAVMPAAMSTQYSNPVNEVALSAEIEFITSGMLRSGLSPPVSRFNP